MDDLLTDTVHHLGTRGYTMSADLIERNHDLLVRLNSMTIFAVDDDSIYDDRRMFVSNFRFHIVPNWRMTGFELINLPADTELSTMVAGDKLLVTEAGGGGFKSPMRINNVEITDTDIVSNEGIVVHGVAAPLPRVP